MDVGGSLLATAPERLAVDGDSLPLVASVERAGGRCHDAFRPLAQLGFQLLSVQVAQHGVERTRTGGLVTGETDSMRQLGSVVAPPFRDGYVTTISTQHCGAGHC